MRVLYVEDHEMNRRVIGAMLSSANAVMVEALDGAEGLKAIEADEFDVVLMDLRMPGVDGLSALREIRARSDAKARLPVIVLTADVLPSVQSECLAAGANVVLHKPVGVKSLFAAIGSALAVRAAA